MNLVEFQSEIEDMIETQNFDQRPHLESLATQSPEHQRVWEDYLILEQTLPAWKQSLPEVDLVEAVISQLADLKESDPEHSNPTNISSPQQKKLDSKARWIYASVLTVAAVLIAVSINLWIDDSSLITPNTLIVNQTQNSYQPDSETKSDNKLNQLLQNARAASWGLAQSTAGTMTEAVNLVPVTQSDPNPEKNIPEESNWVEDINKEMQPLKEQIGHAWYFIIHSVPEDATKI